MMDPELVAMDKCHLQLIASVAGALKPRRILELGYGSGRLTHLLLDTLQEYGLPCVYFLVDNWIDWGHMMPAEVAVLAQRINVITSPESRFVDGAVTDKEQYDLIISDADHNQSHKWFPEVVEKLLASGGVAFFHDVSSPDYPDLQLNIGWLRARSITWHEMTGNKGPHLMWKVFDKSSLPAERCERGLLMVMKP